MVFGISTSSKFWQWIWRKNCHMKRFFKIQNMCFIFFNIIISLIIQFSENQHQRSNCVLKHVKLYLYGDIYPFSNILMGTDLACRDKTRVPTVELSRKGIKWPVWYTLWSSLSKEQVLTGYVCLMGILNLWGHHPFCTVSMGTKFPHKVYTVIHTSSP